MAREIHFINHAKKSAYALFFYYNIGSNKKRCSLKKFKFILAFFMLAASFNSYSAVRYISDDIYVFLLAGPGTQYRITGTIKVGEKVDTLKYDAATKFMRVKTRAGKIGWVKNSELQQGLPAKIRLPAIQKQLTK